MPLFYTRPRPEGVGALLRPMMGGPDRAFNTRYRDVTVGATKPGPDNTGVLPGSNLRRISSSIVIPETSTGEVFENLDISGRILNQGNGTTIIRNCRIHLDVAPEANTAVVTNQRPSASTILIDCELYSTVSSRLVNGILGGNIYALRTKIHDTVDFASIYCVGGDNPDGPTNTTFEACYGYDLLYYSPDPTHAGTDNNTHNDGIQIQGGGGTVARGNFFDMTEGPLSYFNEAGGGHPSYGIIGQGVTITPVRGATHGFLVENNWFDHGMRGIIAEGTAGLISGTVRNNKFGRNIYTSPSTFHGPIVSRPGWFEGFPATSGLATQGNVYEDTNEPVPVLYRGE